MNLKRAFQAQNKLNKILDETKSKFDLSYYTRITKTEKKSEINKLIPGADFVDEVTDMSDEKYGMYQPEKLIKVLSVVWHERTKLAVGIAIAKNNLIIEEYDANDKLAYDAVITMNNDRRKILDNPGLDYQFSIANSRRTSREQIPYHDGFVSYTVVTEKCLDENVVNLYKQFKKNTLKECDRLSNALEESVYKVELNPKYEPLISSEMEFEDVYSNIDALYNLIIEDKEPADN